LKIKCPFEPFESAPDYTKDGLSWHLQEDHEVRGVIADYFTNILFKIHEKIEDFRKKEFEIRKGYGYNDPEANRLNLMIKELKSLLEDEK
jgi:hypothetical protein